MATEYPVFAPLSITGVAKAASGTAYLYLTGTSRQANVYGDQSGATSVTQPITLDSAGRSPVPIFTADPIRLVLYDSTGVQVFDSDESNTDVATLVRLNNSGSTDSTVDAFVSKVLASLGAADALYKDNANATGLALKTRLGVRQVLSSYNPAGDGATDDVAAFNAALSYLNSVGGGTLVIPGKTYAIASAIAHTYHNIIIEGVGRASIIKNLSTSDDAIRITNANSVGVRSLQVTAATSSTGSAIKLLGCVTGMLVSPQVSGHAFGINIDASTGASAQASNDITIIDPAVLFSTGANNAGVKFSADTTTGSGGLTVLGGFVSSNNIEGSCFLVGGGVATTSVSIDNVRMLAGGYGVRAPTSSGPFIGLKVVNCDMSLITTTAIALQDNGSHLTNFYEANNRYPSDLTKACLDNAAAAVVPTHLWTSPIMARRPHGNTGVLTAIAQTITTDISVTTAPDLSLGNVFSYTFTYSAAGKTVTMTAPTNATNVAHGSLMYLRVAKAGANVATGGIAFSTAAGAFTGGETNYAASVADTQIYVFMYDGIASKWRQVNTPRSTTT